MYRWLKKRKEIRRNSSKLFVIWQHRRGIQWLTYRAIRNHRKRITSHFLRQGIIPQLEHFSVIDDLMEGFYVPREEFFDLAK